MSNEPLTPKRLTVSPITDDGIKALIANVSDNPAKVEFPTDKWGFTSAIRKEVLKAASNVKGNEEKHNLLLGTLAILCQHIMVRKEGDLFMFDLRRKEMREAADELAPRQRIAAGPVNTLG